MALLLLLSIEVPTYSDFIADSVKKLHNVIYCGKCKILYYSTIYVQFFFPQSGVGNSKKHSLVFYPIFIHIIPQLIHTMRAGTTYRWAPTVTIIPSYTTISINLPYLVRSSSNVIFWWHLWLMLWYKSSSQSVFLLRGCFKFGGGGTSGV